MAFSNKLDYSNEDILRFNITLNVPRSILLVFGMDAVDGHIFFRSLLYRLCSITCHCIGV